MYDYAIIRIVPRVEREEFVNVGAIVSCGPQKILAARISLDEKRLIAIDPTVDLETIRNHLAVIPIICAGGKPAGKIGQLPHRERFHWIVAPRSTIVQTSRIHTGFCHNLDAALDRLMDTMVHPLCDRSAAVENTQLPDFSEKLGIS
jgi:hypothetical protein